jgi:hypothetical protein
MRRSDQPSRPSATICCCRCWSKTLLMTATEPSAPAVVNASVAMRGGRFSGVDRWPVSSVYRGFTRVSNRQLASSAARRQRVEWSAIPATVTPRLSGRGQCRRRLAKRARSCCVLLSLHSLIRSRAVLYLEILALRHSYTFRNPSRTAPRLPVATDSAGCGPHECGHSRDRCSSS